MTDTDRLDKMANAMIKWINDDATKEEVVKLLFAMIKKVYESESIRHLQYVAYLNLKDFVRQMKFKPTRENLAVAQILIKQLFKPILNAKISVNGNGDYFKICEDTTKNRITDERLNFVFSQDMVKLINWRPRVFYYDERYQEL